MALYTVHPRAQANDVIPVVSGSCIFAAIVGIEQCLH